jgi:hypothetical protein
VRLDPSAPIAQKRHQENRLTAIWSRVALQNVYSSTAVPEPGSLALASVAAIGWGDFPAAAVGTGQGRTWPRMGLKPPAAAN